MKGGMTRLHGMTLDKAATKTLMGKNAWLGTDNAGWKVA